MPSPYIAEIEKTVQEIFLAFMAEFEVNASYAKSNLELGKNYGVIAPIEYRFDESRPTSYQDCFLKFGITLSRLCETRLEASSKIAGFAMAIHHGIPAMKEAINEWQNPGTSPYNFGIDGSISAMTETTPSPPYRWQIYVVAEAVMSFKIYKDIQEKHALDPHG